jgi:hypothetical protein
MKLLLLPALLFAPVSGLSAAALERARSDKRVVKRDASAWLFGGRASSGDTLVKGVAVALDALIRRLGP